MAVKEKILGGTLGFQCRCLYLIYAIILMSFASEYHVVYPKYNSINNFCLVLKWYILFLIHAGGALQQMKWD